MRILLNVNLSNRIKLKYLLVIILSLIVGTKGVAQLQITLQKPPVNKLETNDLWNVQINNPQQQQEVYLIATIHSTKANKRMALFRTRPFEVSGGLTRLDPQRIQVTQEEFFDNQAEEVYQRTQNFPGGTYRIRIEMYNALDDSKIAEARQQQKVINVHTSAQKLVKGGKEQFVTFYGNGYLEGHKTNRQTPGQHIPRQYARTNMNATVEIGMAPIQFHGYYTTIQSNLRQSANAFTVSFDDQRFINNLRNNLTNIIEEETGIKDKEYSSAVNKLKKLDNIDRLLENQNIEKQLEEAGNLESIEQKLKNADLQNAIDQVNQIKTGISNRVTDLNYDTRKAKLQTELQVHQEVSYDDPEKEQRRKEKVDSLQTEIQELEEKKQHVKQKNQEDIEQLEKLEEKQQTFEKLKQKKRKVENLLDKKEKIEKLARKKKKLQRFKKKLERTGGLDNIQSFNFQKLQDKDMLKQELLKRGMLSTSDKLLYGVEELTAGTLYPYYSPLVLNGIRMTGVSFEWNPGLFYTAFTGGTSSQPKFSLDQGVANYKQRLWAGKIGVGKKHKSHFYITGLRAIDDRNSIQQNDTLGTPQSNTIVGTDIGLSFFKGNFKLNGEIAASKYEADTEASVINADNELDAEIPDFLQPKVSTHLGLGYDFRGAVKVFKKQTVLSGFLRNIDPAYNSFGAPSLRRGVFTYQAKLSQKLFERNVTLSVFRKNESTTRLWQDGLTHYERQGGEIAFSFSDIPRLRASYAKNVQNKENIDNDMRELMVSASHSYQLGELSLSNTVSYNLNTGESSQENGPNYKVTNYLFNQLVSFPFPLSLSLNVNYVDEQLQGEESEQIITDLSVSYQLFKQVDVSMGGVYKSEPETSKKVGGYADISYSFARYFTFRLSFENNYYDNMMIPDQNFDEYILNSKLSVQW